MAIKNKKKATLESLAGMVQRGFTEVRSEIAGVRDLMATKEDIKEIWDELRAIRNEMATKQDMQNFARSWASEVVELQGELKEVKERLSVLEGKKSRRKS